MIMKDTDNSGLLLLKFTIYHFLEEALDWSKKICLSGDTFNATERIEAVDKTDLTNIY